VCLLHSFGPGCGSACVVDDRGGVLVRIPGRRLDIVQVNLIVGVVAHDDVMADWDVPANPIERWVDQQHRSPAVFDDVGDLSLA